MISNFDGIYAPRMQLPKFVKIKKIDAPSLSIKNRRTLFSPYLSGRAAAGVEGRRPPSLIPPPGLLFSFVSPTTIF